MSIHIHTHTYIYIYILLHTYVYIYIYMHSSVYLYILRENIFSTRFMCEAHPDKKWRARAPDRLACVKERKGKQRKGKHTCKKAYMQTSGVAWEFMCHVAWEWI